MSSLHQTSPTTQDGTEPQQVDHRKPDPQPGHDGSPLHLAGRHQKDEPVDRFEQITETIPAGLFDDTTEDEEDLEEEDDIEEAEDFDEAEEVPDEDDDFLKDSPEQSELDEEPFDENEYVLDLAPGGANPACKNGYSSYGGARPIRRSSEAASGNFKHALDPMA